MPLTKPVDQRSVISTEPSSTVASTDRLSPVCSQKENMVSNEAKICWIEVNRYPYQPDHQVELLHLQAEADALLIKLQAAANKS